MAATTSPRRKWRRQATTRSLGLKVDTIANLGAYLSLFSSSVPTYLYATLLSGQYDIPAIYAECDASTPTPRRSTPIAAQGGRKRPMCSSG
jgi:carbon-monoxide dehydrogenase large subunit